MKSKGNVKRVSKPNFWGEREDKIPLDLKEMVYDQYYSRNTLYVYCDSSCSKVSREMAVACTYLRNGSIIVKNQLVYSPKDVLGKNIFGELKAVIFGLTHFKKYLEIFHDSVTIFSDVKDIESLLSNEISFKNNHSLKKLHFELITLYERKKRENPKLNLEIKYLPIQYKKHNPFMKSAHNASRKLLRRS
ncbi:hypothetical protein ACWE42_18590 [Sutcliffiella cohnii]